MANKLRWGILGTGVIARTFAAALRESRTGELAAVGSRDAQTAREFCARHGGTAHGSYEALLADESVEAVYLALPHALHAEWAIKAAEARRHILCEKPLTLNHAEALRVVEAARRNGVFLMEAMMYRCHPQTLRLVELLQDGVIGEVQLVKARFAFRLERVPGHRLFQRPLGGGAILDIGCYCMSMARLAVGAAIGRPFAEPEVITGCGVVNPISGVDESAIAALRFPNGILGELACGIRMALDNMVRIWGTAGSIVVPSPWLIAPAGGFSKIVVFKSNVPQEIVIESDLGVYAREIDYVAAHLADGEAPAMTLDDSLGNMLALDRWRAAVGVVYDADQTATRQPAPVTGV